jgi:sirohydrochlorin cobaltochelatase
MTGLILFAHGARDARWSAPFETVAARIRAAHPKLAVRLAFLEFMQPGLVEAGTALAREGVSHLDIVPMFLGAGGHVRQDLPGLVDELRAACPGLAVVLHPAIGEIDAVTSAMAAAIVTTVMPTEAPR